MFKNRFMPFYEEDGAGGGGDPKEPEKKSFDDILGENKEYQAEFDRRIQKGIETALANEKRKLEKLADDKITEAEKLAQMSELEKQQYLAKKTEADLKKREAELNKRELMATAKVTLAEGGFPAELASLLDYTDADSVQASIKTVTETYSGAVKAGVDARLKGGTPPREATNNNNDEMKALNDQILGAMRAPY